MKTYTNKSNAARAAKAANGGNLNGLELRGQEGAWYYAPAEQQAPSEPAVALSPSMGTPTNGKAKKSAPAKKLPPGTYTAKVASATVKGGKVDVKLADVKPKAPAKKAAKKVATKKAAPARKPAQPAEEYDVKHGPTQGRISGYHIDADRDEKHGVKRRSSGTIGGRLWAIFDKLAAKAGGAEKLEIAAVKEHKDVADFNANKVVIEFYYWRRYHGVRGRGKKQKVAKS